MKRKILQVYSTLLDKLKVLEREIRMNTILTDLNISSHAISPEIAAMFASLLGATASLTSLDLGNSSFGDAVRTFCFLQL